VLVALALPARALAQEAPAPATPKGPGPADPKLLKLDLDEWARGSPQYFSEGQKKKLPPVEAARIALITRRDNPRLVGDANKLLRDVTSRLSTAEVACLQGWFGRDPGLELRYTQGMLDARRTAEARAQAMALLAQDATSKDAVNLLHRMDSSPATDSIPIAAGAAQSVYHVELFAPQHGDYEAFGRSLRAGLEIAVAEYNAGAKLPIHLTVHETEGEGWRAAREGKRALDDGAGVLIGDVLTVPTLVLAGLANQTGVPLLSPSATDPRVGATGPLVFQTGAPVEAQARTLARYAVRTDKRTVIAVPANLDSSFLNSFAAEARQLGAKVVRVPVSTGLRDFRPVANEIQRTKAEALLLPLDPEQAELWVAGLMKVGVFPPYLATDALDPQGFHAETRRVLEGMVAVSSDYALPENEFAHVDSLAHAAYGLSADRFVRRGYLTGRVMTAALAGGADSPASFAAALRKRAGPLGFIRYEESEAPLPIMAVRRGQLVRVH
jgi:branched-chain amino acid transport system substrate-binding protein